MRSIKSCWIQSNYYYGNAFSPLFDFRVYNFFGIALKVFSRRRQMNFENRSKPRRILRWTEIRRWVEVSEVLEVLKVCGDDVKLVQVFSEEVELRMMCHLLPRCLATGMVPGLPVLAGDVEILESIRLATRVETVGTNPIVGGQTAKRIKKVLVFSSK